MIAPLSDPLYNCRHSGWVSQHDCDRE